MQVGGKWLLYYTAANPSTRTQCIGVAVADSPKGPFRRSVRSEPLVCQPSEGGTIDANPFRDEDGKLYLYYKSDGNAVGKKSIVWGQRLSDDGLKLVGDAVPLIQDDQPWEWKLVEAPAMVKSPGGYQMFYSAAYYGWDYPKERLSRYATGYATCAGPLGPCKDAPENPILNSFNDREAGCLSGPGHPAIFKVGQRHFIAFHAWEANSGCRPVDPRALPLHRAAVLEGRQAADRSEPAAADEGGKRLSLLAIALAPRLRLRRATTCTATRLTSRRAGPAQRTVARPRARADERTRAPRVMRGTECSRVRPTFCPT